MTVRILIGDARDRLKELPDESVHCVVTSPPYWGLRDYGVDGQLGLEATPSAYVAEMVAVLREIRRVLRSDGTLWLNLGDSYHNGDKGGYARDRVTAMDSLQVSNLANNFIGAPNRQPQAGLKPKDLVGMPWRVAFALQADGWWLRQDIIWSKPNPMPESITDRCTKAHEYLFLLSKSERYYYAAAAIAEEASGDPDAPRNQWDTKDYLIPGQKPQKRTSRSGNKERKPASARGVPVDTGGSSNGAIAGSIPWEGSTRNKRSVWTVGTKPFPEAHFATFPPALIEPCILAGCPKGGTVLDPFFGAGTTGLVADRNGRNCIGIELNPAYAAMADNRIRQDAGMFHEAAE